MKKFTIFILIFIFSFLPVLSAKQVRFTQEDRDRLIKIEATLKVFMHQVDKQFEQVDKRFEMLQKSMDNRFNTQQQNMNNRFSMLQKRMDNKFEMLQKDMDKRFEQVNNRFKDLINFLWMIVGIFTAIMVGAIGFAFWDRMTTIRKAKQDTIEHIEKEGRLRDVINALRDLAKVNPDIKKILKDYHLL